MWQSSKEAGGVVADLSGSLPAHIFPKRKPFMCVHAPVPTEAAANIISKCSLFDIDIDPGAGGDLVELIF